VAEAYQAVFDTACVGGLDTPEKHRNYMRYVTMTDGAGQTHLNATHFYLASLLSLQRRSGVLGSSKKPLYTGRREFARTLFTTNFDPLLQTSLQLFQLLYYMTDRPELLPPDALQTDHHPAIHLFYAHGSVHRPYMANTEEQIALLKQQNARDLAAYLGSHGVIVLGYSGWDDCLLEALNQCKTFGSNLYWLVLRGGPLSEPVHKFLASHANAYCVEIEDGGVFMADLHARLCPGAPNTELLYNPIQPLRRQLQCVNLSGIRSGSQAERADSGEDDVRSDLPRDVDSIRQAVLSRLDDAERLFVEEAPPRPDIDQKLAQADISYANKDWAAALALYDELLTSHSALPVETKALALFRRGVCFGKKGDRDNAIEDYTAVIDLPLAPVVQVAKARLNRGIEFSINGDDERAIEDYTAIIELPLAPAKQVAKARLNRGNRFKVKGDRDKAIEDYTAVIDLPLAPVVQVAMAWLKRGFCLGENGDQDKELENYTAVIDLPGAPPEQMAIARFNRGLCFIQKGDPDKAVADFTAVIDLPGAPATQVAKARLLRGLWLCQNGDHPRAQADFAAIIDLPGAPADIVEKAHEQLSQSERRIAQQPTAELTRGGP
jgi:tetratricopeptide (TPR) repeat protein